MPANEYYKFALGAMTCYVLSDVDDSTLTIDKLASRYPQADEAAIVAALQAAGETGESSESAMNPFAVKTGGSLLLMDTGMGTQAGPNVGHLQASLAKAGITPDDVDIVFITHFHPDHTFGLLDADGQPVYPNARYLCSATEMHYWMSDEALATMDEQRVTGIRESVAPLRERFTLVADGDELAPGITAVVMPGHTPGHTGMLLESNGERLLHVVDLLHNIVQLGHPDWHHIFDSHPEQAVITRKATLSRAADENLLTAFYHLPFPAIGRVTRQGDAFAFTQEHPSGQ